MNKLNKYLWISVMAAGLAIAGCSSDGKKDGAGAKGKGSSGLSTGGAGTSGTGSGRELTGGVDLSQHVIYFDFDSSELRADAQAVVANWAKYLSQNPSARVRLEGHTDERGTREYNVALGERRSRAVQQALQLRGVTAGQLSAISYGEERPVSMGHDESAWGQNRRVEIVK
jgi:peptidoglycan-associated lipoprotein